MTKNPSKSRLPKGYSVLDAKKHGFGGIIKGEIKKRKQDKTAEPWEGYAVIFFPKIEGIGAAYVSYCGANTTLSTTPEAAIARFMDEIKKGETWASYQRAGHRVRKVRISDLGDA